MIALGFTNFVFFSYAMYILIEQKLQFYKSIKFWLMCLGLLVSLYITMISIPVNIPAVIKSPLLAP